MAAFILALEAELANLKNRYTGELKSLSRRLEDTIENTEKRGSYSTHAAFNMASNCQTLQEIASKIEQTAMILRDMKTRLELGAQ